MLIRNRAGNLAYEVEPSEVEGVAIRHGAHVEADRIVDDETGRTLFSIEGPGSMNGPLCSATEVSAR